LKLGRQRGLTSIKTLNDYHGSRVRKWIEIRIFLPHGIRIGSQLEHLGLQLLPVLINGGYPCTGAEICLHMASNSLK
jgi:hypothetical protein